MAEPAVSGGSVQQLLGEQPARVSHCAQLPGGRQPVALEGLAGPAAWPPPCPLPSPARAAAPARAQRPTLVFLSPPGAAVLTGGARELLVLRCPAGGRSLPWRSPCPLQASPRRKGSRPAACLLGLTVRSRTRPGRPLGPSRPLVPVPAGDAWPGPPCSCPLCPCPPAARELLWTIPRSQPEADEPPGRHGLSLRASVHLPLGLCAGPLAGPPAVALPGNVEQTSVEIRNPGWNPSGGGRGATAWAGCLEPAATRPRPELQEAGDGISRELGLLEGKKLCEICALVRNLNETSLFCPLTL